MLTREKAKKAVHNLVRRNHVVKMGALLQTLQTGARMSAFRLMRELDYHSSFTHSGCYYTLPSETRFDELGLWFYKDIGFSKAGNLKQTVVEQVKQSEHGRTHNELRNLLQVRRAYDALVSMYRSGRIGREPYGQVYLYTSADSVRGAEQVASRHKLDASITEMLRVATDEEVVEILTEALRVAPEIPAPDVISQRLMARGFNLEPHHVTQVYEANGLEPGKKKR